VRIYCVRIGDNAPSLAGALSAAAASEHALDRGAAFENLGGGSDDEAFADGLTEDVITELSRFSGVSGQSFQLGLPLQGQALRRAVHASLSGLHDQWPQGALAHQT
jgi:hypothetical protein